MYYNTVNVYTLSNPAANSPTPDPGHRHDQTVNIKRPDWVIERYSFIQPDLMWRRLIMAAKRSSSLRSRSQGEFSKS